MWLMWRKSDRPIQVNCDGDRAVIPTVGKKQTGCGCSAGLALHEQGASEGACFRRRFVRRGRLGSRASVGTKVPHLG